jgi:hypothetical protein
VATNIYGATSLIGSASGSLDSIASASLVDKDMAYVVVGGYSYVYILDDDSGIAENSPLVVKPDDEAGNKRWILQSPISSLYRTLWVPAASMIPTVTNGATSGSKEFVTNDINMDYLAFNTTTEQFAAFSVVLPENWDRGTIKAKFYWAPTNNSGSSANTVEWEIAAVAISNDDAIDVALGTSQVISMALTSVGASESGYLHITPATPAVTVGGTPALGDLVHFKISRNVGGTDTYGYDALLFGALIQCTTNIAAVSAW